jgi:hypothetical protein
MSVMKGAAKAVLAALIAFLGSLATALVDGNSLSQVADGQWVTAILAGLMALGVVYGVANKLPA